MTAGRGEPAAEAGAGRERRQRVLICVNAGQRHALPVEPVENDERGHREQEDPDHLKEFGIQNWDFGMRAMTGRVTEFQIPNNRTAEDAEDRRKNPQD